MKRQFWLMKSDPDEYTITDLMEQPDQTDHWDGVRNYQARNFMRDDMLVGDQVLFYHSRTHPSVVGLARIVTAGYPDHTAWDPKSKHHDPKSTPDNPIWYMVDIKFVYRFHCPIPLADLRDVPALSGMQLLRKGNRLSVMPVTAEEFETILAMAERPAKN